MVKTHARRISLGKTPVHSVEALNGADAGSDLNATHDSGCLVSVVATRVCFPRSSALAIKARVAPYYALQCSLLREKTRSERGDRF
jgi:hypothetical protein